MQRWLRPPAINHSSKRAVNKVDRSRESALLIALLIFSPALEVRPTHAPRARVHDTASASALAHTRRHDPDHSTVRGASMANLVERRMLGVVKLLIFLATRSARDSTDALDALDSERSGTPHGVRDDRAHSGSPLMTNSQFPALCRICHGSAVGPPRRVALVSTGGARGAHLHRAQPLLQAHPCPQLSTNS